MLTGTQIECLKRPVGALPEFGAVRSAVDGAHAALHPVDVATPPERERAAARRDRDGGGHRRHRGLSPATANVDTRAHRSADRTVGSRMRVRCIGRNRPGRERLKRRELAKRAVLEAGAPLRVRKADLGFERRRWVSTLGGRPRHRRLSTADEGLVGAGTRDGGPAGIGGHRREHVEPATKHGLALERIGRIDRVEYPGLDLIGSGCGELRHQQRQGARHHGSGHRRAGQLVVLPHDDLCADGLACGFGSGGVGLGTGVAGLLALTGHGLLTQDVRDVVERRDRVASGGPQLSGVLLGTTEDVRDRARDAGELRVGLAVEGVAPRDEIGAHDVEILLQERELFGGHPVPKPVILVVLPAEVLHIRGHLAGRHEQAAAVVQVRGDGGLVGLRERVLSVPAVRVLAGEPHHDLALHGGLGGRTLRVRHPRVHVGESRRGERTEVGVQARTLRLAGDGSCAVVDHEDGSAGNRSKPLDRALNERVA